MQTFNLTALAHPKSPVSEAFRTLRTNIQFSSFDKNIKTIVLTSSGPGEGKSTVSTNLACVFSQGGNKTILIDCDMRKPTVHKKLEISNQTGLTNVLIAEVSLKDAVKEISENFYVLTTGTRPPNPAEIIASSKMQNFIESLKEQFDYIIIDTPPILMVTDAQILSKYADGTLLVVSSGEADKNAAVKAKELLLKVDANILGVVLNKLDTSRKGYYGYYYHYYYGNDGHKKKVKEKKGLFFKKRREIGS
ncbi:capsular exopolysaccharide family [Caloramator quimbayensis]|uniref:non-specific protein-tyrosine kinase n=1 Tax=Caloramator quimbayensis TaxID=1147123 RepID=A0A1T4XGG8_9CLOT|nr:CpsD/CapB family tyrosine-protein kinase [Caloramator quimbayensis]SKA88644.1 capsular exopolysaccharide family [Caloramator quimbayensis]